MTIEATLKFAPAPDRLHSCVGCIGEHCTDVCNVLPDCIGLGPDGLEMLPGSKGHGIIWVLLEPAS
jgi:hypothetical protein